MPTWPTSVETATLTFGKGITADGNQTAARLIVRPKFNGTKTVIWAADGTPVYGFELRATADVGGYQTVRVPVVDQAGWLDDGQNQFTRWYYEVTEIPVYGDTDGESRTKAWQPLSGVGNYDFDRIPDGSAGLPVVTPQPGGGTSGPAGGFLSGSFPNPGVNQTAFSNAMLARAPIYWQPATYYPAGTQVLAPDGSTVQRITAGTSGSVYDASAWTVIVSSAASDMATSVTLWKASTAYKQGQAVLNPAGAVVTALADFTSGSSYDATKWSTPPSSGGASGIALDTDGVPYYSPGGSTAIALDTDGVPYLAA